MNAEPATVSPAVSLTAAAATMRARGIGSAVVVDGRSVVGILTERDVRARAVAAGSDPRDGRGARLDDPGAAHRVRRATT
jgi:CBS domain-containing protein